MDLANTIKFNQVIRFLKEIDEINPRQISQKKLSPKYLFLIDAYKDHQDVINKAIVELIEINGALEHRYRDAIVSSYEGGLRKDLFWCYVLFPWFDEYMYREHIYIRVLMK
ncbi:hypothetical protein SPD48_05075 [Pseudogracilibacillus sp. SE30717A]|uniref:nuclease domain-containing protein n=1 Tax=Pseudogracilibacillus sp. SE30717A TaxID=3098293 RepID=UPI00300E201B